MILDTNAVSAMADGDRLLEPVLRRARLAALPVIVIGEFRYGIRQSRNRERYESWLDEMILNCRVLPVDEATPEHYAELRDQLKRLGRPIPSNDLWIAALALQHRLPVLSRDRHFDAVEDLRRILW